MLGISKRFVDLVAIDAIDFEVKSGEICALLGENGAGKSTLMKILYGLYRADSGSISIAGKSAVIDSPAVAIAFGIGMVHQHFELVPTMTVWENVVLGFRHGGLNLLSNVEAIKAKVADVSASYGLKVNPDALVSDLSIGQQQRVELVKALYRGANILVLDEPTAVLTPQEVHQLFIVLDRMRSDGKSIVFISHKMKEVLKISDRIVVLRTGRVVADIPREDATQDGLARHMVGRVLLQEMPARKTPEVQVVLDVKKLTVLDEYGAEAVKSVSFAVRKHEILGIAGVAGNGQKQLMECLFGMRKASSGGIALKGRDIVRCGPKELIQLGVSRTPEDRMGTGSIGDFSVWENLVAEVFEDEPYSKWGHLDRAYCLEQALKLIADFRIKVTSVHDPVKVLSGGNIQKVILARELAGSPQLVIVDQPFNGLDIGAIEYIKLHLVRIAEQGSAVLMVCDDLEELLALCDRVIVMYEGSIAGEVRPRDVSIEQIGLMMAGGVA
jgi:simple sugar transport system ATP-binding protein